MTNSSEILVDNDALLKSNGEFDLTKIIDQSLTGEELVTKLREITKIDESNQHIVDEVRRRASNFDLDPILLDLNRREPFFGYLSRRLTKLRTDRVPTAAVTVTNDAFIMFWNPNFFWRIAPDASCGSEHRKKVMGVLIHEMYHIILEHVLIRNNGMKHHVLANMAFDLAINCMINRELLPDGLLLPGEPLGTFTDDEGIYRPEEMKQYKALSAFVESLPKNQASEFYYNELLTFIEQNNPEMLEDPNWGLPNDQRGEDDDDSGESGNSGSGGADPGESDGQGEGDAKGNSPGKGQSPGKGKIPDSAKKGYGRLGNFDNHNQWHPSKDVADREFIKQRVEDLLRTAINEADNANSHNGGNGWGSIPAEMQGLLRQLVSRQVDWRVILRQFIGNRQRLNKSTSMTRINRRFPMIHPGIRKSRGATLYIYIDQSGSVSDESISLLFAELNQLAKNASFKVFFFDTEVDLNYIDWRKGSKNPPQRRRCGGTDFNAATDHANKSSVDHDGYIILTDGECCKPNITSIRRRAWIITPGDKLAFETTDTVVQMQVETKK